jgi:hypothetical protein
VSSSRLLAEAGDLASLRALVDEADAYFDAGRDASEAGRFYNELAVLAETPAAREAADDLRDRALVGLADQLRLHAAGGSAGRLVSDLFGATGRWPATLVGDAAAAVAAAARGRDDEPPPVSDPAVRRIRASAGVVTAFAAAIGTGEIFLGFERGEVVCYRAVRDEVVSVAAYDLPVAALAVDPEARELVVLRAHATGRGVISTYARQPDGAFRLRLGMSVDRLERPWLTPVAPLAVGSLFGFWDGSSLNVFEAESLTSHGSITPPGGSNIDPTAGLLCVRGEAPEAAFSALLHDGWQWSLIDEPGVVSCKTGLTWLPSAGRESPLRAAAVAAAGDPAGLLDLAGLDAKGMLHWARLQDGCLIARNSAFVTGGYLAAAIVRDDLVAAVAPRRVEWLRCGSARFTPWRMTDAALAAAVAGAAVRQTRELVVIGRDGWLTLVPFPRR